jgi:hypothetical protein
MKRQSVLLFLIFSMFFATWDSVSARAVVFSDGTFNPSDWILYTEEIGTGGLVTIEHRTDGGNPDHYCYVVVSVGSHPVYSYMAAFYQNKNAVYIPKTQGAILSLDYEEDGIMFQGFGNGQTTGPALMQNGKVYYGCEENNMWLQANQYTWTHLSATGLTRENFVTICEGFRCVNWDDNPDFSANGAPIHFGFFRIDAWGPYVIYGGIDNWSVTIHNKLEDGSAGSSLQVIIEPQEAVGAGAKWRRVGTAAWYDSGHIEMGIPIGEHIVQFKDVFGFVTPDDIEIIEPDSTLPLTAFYVFTDTEPNEPFEPDVTHVFYDDFVYADSSVPELSQFGWHVRTPNEPGGPGVKGAEWTSEQVTFDDDLTDKGDRFLIMGASTSGDPNYSQHSQIITDEIFFEGTYAARVRLTDKPVDEPDVNDKIVQAFFSINDLQYDYDFSYSECDFEYLPNGGWGPSQPTMFVSSWATYKPEYKPEPQVSIKETHTYSGSLDDGQWHILRFEISKGQVNYFIDDSLAATHSGIYYPESVMKIAFNNWFISLASESEHRQYEFYVDWVFHAQDSILNDTSIENIISEYRLQGYKRLNTMIIQTIP